MAERSQVQQVIETLNKDLPTLFEQDISYDIYTPDIYFQDPVNKFKWKFNYRIIFWTLRFHAKLFFRKIYFDLHDVYRKSEDTIIATWTVRGAGSPVLKVINLSNLCVGWVEPSETQLF